MVDSWNGSGSVNLSMLIGKPKQGAFIFDLLWNLGSTYGWGQIKGREDPLNCPYATYRKPKKVEVVTGCSWEQDTQEFLETHDKLVSEEDSWGRSDQLKKKKKKATFILTHEVIMCEYIETFSHHLPILLLWILWLIIFKMKTVICKEMIHRAVI